VNLQEALGDTQLTREKLFSVFEAAIREKFAVANIEPHCPDSLDVTLMDGRNFTLYLENLWRTLQHQTTESRVNIFENHVRSVYSAFGTDTGSMVTRENIVPTIKDSEYFSVGGDWNLVREHLVGDIWILYSLDLPHSILTLRKETFQSLGMSMSDLRALACENLRRILPDIEQHGSGPWYLITAGRDYVASILLLDEVWTESEGSVEGDIVAAVPSRDVLLVTGSRSKEGIEHVRRRVREIHETGDHLISQTLFRRTAGTWKVFE